MPWSHEPTYHRRNLPNIKQKFYRLDPFLWGHCIMSWGTLKSGTGFQEHCLREQLHCWITLR